MRASPRLAAPHVTISLRACRLHQPQRACACSTGQHHDTSASPSLCPAYMPRESRLHPRPPCSSRHPAMPAMTGHRRLGARAHTVVSRHHTRPHQSSPSHPRHALVRSCPCLGSRTEPSISSLVPASTHPAPCTSPACPIKPCCVPQPSQRQQHCHSFHLTAINNPPSLLHLPCTPPSVLLPSHPGRSPTCPSRALAHHPPSMFPFAPAISPQIERITSCSYFPPAPSPS